MKYSKPKVTIDLDEYNELKKIQHSIRDKGLDILTRWIVYNHQDIIKEVTEELYKYNLEIYMDAQSDRYSIRSPKDKP